MRSSGEEQGFRMWTKGKRDGVGLRLPGRLLIGEQMSRRRRRVHATWDHLSGGNCMGHLMLADIVAKFINYLSYKFLFACLNNVENNSIEH